MGTPTLDYYRTQKWITVPLSVLTQILKVTISTRFNHEYEHLKCHFKLFLISLHEIHGLTLAYVVIHTRNRIIHGGVVDYAVRT